MKNIILLFSFILSSYALALDSQNIASQDSKLILEDKTTPGTQWVFFRIVRNGDPAAEQVLTRITDNHYSQAIYLRKGAGKYTITVSESASPEKMSTYTQIKILNAENLDQRDTSFLLPSPYVESDDSKIISTAQLITDGATDEVEVVKRIHDFVITNIEYDYDSYYSGQYRRNPFDAVTVLENKKAVCSGYANIFAALLRASGLRAKIISGKALVDGTYYDHAWNEVYVNGDWKIVDTTWDAADPKAYAYFFPGPEQFSRDHQKLSEKTDF